MITDDEYLERIVAGIHSVTSDGADVRWNQKINGRQFDVVVRFELGTLRYLVVIEVKNRTRRASASDVEAFVTKAGDQNANKVVFVSAAGFQKGAIKVASRHGVELFTVGFNEDKASIPPEATVFVREFENHPADEVPRLEIGEPTLVSAIEEIRLTYSDGTSHEVPSERTQMAYYVERTHTADGRTLADLIEKAKWATPMAEKAVSAAIDVKPPMQILPPDEYFFPRGRIADIRMKIVGRMARPLTGNVLMETTMFRSPVVYTNATTGEVTELTLEQLPLNNEPLQEGNFYFQFNPLRYFYCAKIEGSIVTWEMIESFQCAELIRGTFQADAVYGAFYIPVSDRKIIQRLERRLDDYRRLRAKGPH